VESAELIALLREVRERVRARHPQTSAGTPGIALPDLLPLVQARDAAMGKVAAIGTVNPRPGGMANTLVQGWKRLVARVLDWHVREQVEYNRKLVACVDASIEALNDTNRALSELAGRISVAEELKDIRNHWAEWRIEWERKLAQNEVQFLRSVADLQGAFQHRATLMDAGYRDALRGQHQEYLAALEHTNVDIQKRLWSDMERMRAEYDRTIHTELRILRQRLKGAEQAGQGSAVSAPPGTAPSIPAFDAARFAERFRGPEEHIRRNQAFYLPYFEGRQAVLDIGCGRGEFLEMMRAAGVAARGIDLDPEAVAQCREKGLDAQVADLFEHLGAMPEESLDGIFCSQVVEHLPPGQLAEMIRLCATRLERGGVIAIETPNPECLAIFATHFYLDPTHTRPIPPPLLAYYLEEFGVGSIEVRRLSPALETMPSLASIPEEFREAFFGGLDYAIAGRKL
jgi:2-polyprenyl-3-methyl-5-hydroxy-6-metoxy-1,4-benzoquinol methylase